MKIHHYDPVTKEYYKTTDARRSPLDKGEIYLIPANATVISPPGHRDGFARCFITDSFQYIEDNRGKTAYNKKDKEPVVINYLGAVDNDYTLVIPCEYGVWDSNTDSWAVDEKLKSEYQDTILKINAQNELASSDSIILSFYEEGEQLPSEWKEYRQELRKIVAGNSENKSLPKKPLIPEKFNTSEKQ